MSDFLTRLGTIPACEVFLDFETFYSSDYSLSKLTTEGYVRDERFEVIGVGVAVGNGSVVWLEEWDFRRWAERVDWKRVALVTHHAHFDGFILSERYGIRPGFHHCTMSVGRALHGEGALEKLARRYGLGEKGDAIKQGTTKGKRRADLTQRQWLAFGDYCRNDVNLMREIFRRMEIPTPERWLVDTTVRMFTEPVFRGDLGVLQKALDEERVKKRAVLTRVAEEQTGRKVEPGEDPIEVARATLASNEKFAALLRSLGVEPGKKHNAKGELTWAFAKSDPAFDQLLAHEDDEIRFLAEARLKVKSTIIETRTERIIGIAQRGRVPFYLKFAGAHTHRWSGGDSMNPQNFNRGGALRAAIIVDDDREIVGADSSQIEARVLPWLAGQRDLLETFRRNDLTGGDFYSDVGSSFFLKKISKEETPTERQLAKNMILGLGFAMGWAKFAGELLKGMLGSKPVQFGPTEVQKFRVDVEAFKARPYGIDGSTCLEQAEYTHAAQSIRIPPAEFIVHCAVAAHFVHVYRTTNGRIAAFWKFCESVLAACERPDGDPDAVRMTFRGFKVMRHRIVKPNGLVLRYPGLKRRGREFGYLGGASGREWTKIYGGKLAENLTQSAARDIVAEQALKVRAHRIKLGTTTHDELVGVVRAGRGAAALQVMLDVMRQPPEWCADLPLNAAGGFGKSYGAVK